MTMTAYKCSVVAQTGKKQKIKYSAESKEEVVDYLKKNKFNIIEIKESGSTLWTCVNRVSVKKIKPKDMAVFCKQIYAMLGAGITIADSLEVLMRQTENKRFALIIGHMYEALQKGNTLSEALSNYKEYFPAIFINMARAGELSGHMDIIMDRMSVHFEKEYKIENKIKSAMTYPAVLAVICVTVVVFLLTTIMPTFAEMYSGSGMPLPTVTALLIDISNALKQYWYIFLIIIFFIAFSVSMLRKNPKVKYIEGYCKLKFPIVKNLSMKISTSRFTRTLSTLIGSGVPLLQALGTVAGATGNNYIKNKIFEAREDVQRGMALSQSLKHQGIFPPMVYSMIKVGEDSGSIEEILDKTADFYDEEVDAGVQQLITMIEPIMIVIMAIIIGFIVIAMVTPMFDMVNTV